MVIQVPLTCMVSTTVALQDILIYVNIFVRGIASANSSSSIDSIGSAIISQLMWFLVLAGGSCEHVFKVSQWARFHHNFRIRIWVQFFCLVGTPLPTSRAGKNPLGGEINKILALVQTMAWRLVTLTEPMLVILLTHICVTRPQFHQPRLVIRLSFGTVGLPKYYITNGNSQY